MGDGAQLTWSTTGPDRYLLGRIYSILGIRPRHTDLPGQAFCTACWDHWHERRWGGKQTLKYGRISQPPVRQPASHEPPAQRAARKEKREILCATFCARRHST